MSFWQNKWNKARAVLAQRRLARQQVASARARGRTGKVCLIVNLAQMGDVVLSAGVAAALRERMPKAVLLFAGLPQWLCVLDGDPCIDGLLALQSLYEVRALARAPLWDTVYLLEIPIPTLLHYLDGVPGIFRYAPPTTADWFTFGQNLMHFYEANAGLPDGTACPRVWVRPEDTAYADTLWARHALHGQVVFTLHTHSSMPAKNWPLERFWELVTRWHAQFGVYFLLVGGPGEGGELEALPGVVNLAGELTVKQTAAVIARSSFFVGPDSGLAYVAEAVGTPGLVILGATVPETSGPRAPSFSFVRAPGACLPACHRACTRTPLCITYLTVDTVDDALQAAWREAQCASR